MALKDLVGGLQDASTVKRVFGDPIERDGALVVPVASIRGGFGGGQGPAAGPQADAAGEAVSWGGGGAWSASPVGIYVLKDGQATWYPAVDANRTILLGILTGIVGLLVVRSIVRSLAKRS
jgi:uncharacterized spore protein YtfJ